MITVFTTALLKIKHNKGELMNDINKTPKIKIVLLNL